MSNRWPSGFVGAAVRAFPVALAVWLWSAPHDAAAQAARVTLLPAGDRASVVVELDETMTGATAIEATDNHTVAVEIGPVRGKVINQLLQAAADSPLVSQVRVRGITRGAEGTIVTIQVSGKTPISGSVRRSARRIYIDLAPLGQVRPSPGDAGRPLNAPVPDAPVIAATTPKVPASPPVAPPTATSPAAAARPASASTSVPAPAPPPAPAPATTASAPPAGTLAPVRPAATAAAAAVAATPAATRPRPLTTAGGTQIADVEARAERLAKLPDVKGLEKLKAELQTQRTAAASDAAGAARIDGLIGRVEQLLLEAQRNRLAADAALFRPDAAPAAPARADQLVAARALRPQLEEIARAVNEWNGGPPPDALVTLSATLPKLRQLHLPARLAEVHTVLCNALEKLAVMWASSAAEPVAPGEPKPAVDAARSALQDFLFLERTIPDSETAQ